MQALIDEEQRKQTEELLAKSDKDERERFFNLPHAKADFKYWSKAAHWTLDEAIALSFGKAPELVTWEKVKPYLGLSAFASRYERRRNLALRELAWKQLFDPVLPSIFLAWAKRVEEPVPQELVDAVTARGVQIADWKSLYDDLKSNFEERHTRWMELSDSKSKLIERLSARITELEDHADVEIEATPERPLRARERESLLKLIIGMAVGGYGYDPVPLRSEQPAAIASDLERAGVALDVDTVRKWLKQAAELLPPKQTE